MQESEKEISKRIGNGSFTFCMDMQLQKWEEIDTYNNLRKVSIIHVIEETDKLAIFIFTKQKEGRMHALLHA